MTPEQLELRVGNLDCEHDAAALRRGLSAVAGITALTVFAQAGKVSLTYDRELTTADAVKHMLASLGFPPLAGREAPAQPRPWRNPKVLASVCSGVLLAVGWLLSHAGVPALVGQAIYLAAILVGGYYFGREAIEALLFERAIGAEALMSVAAVAAFAMGEAAEGAMLVFLYSISEAAEGYTEEKTRTAVRALMKLTPKTALVRRDGQEFEIPVEQLALDDTFVVRPGQAIATDGIVIAGAASVNQAPVTGESLPVIKQVRDPVFAGSINLDGALQVRATKTYVDNTIARIIGMVEEAQERKGTRQRLVERFGARYSPAVLGLGLLFAIAPPLLFSASWSIWLTRAAVFVVAAAPCALVISIPVTMVAALGTAARHGILIKGGVYLEDLANVRAVALDKTGTLTQGAFRVTDVLSCAGGSLHDEDSVLALGAAVEQHSEHFLARSIVRHASERGLAIAQAHSFVAQPGAGASAVIGQDTVTVGSPLVFAAWPAAVACAQDSITRLEREGKTVVLVGAQQQVFGLIALQDSVRPNAVAAVRTLRAAGVEHVVMLTGDNPLNASAMAARVGISEVYAGLRPADKAAKVRELAQRYGGVAMVGDGVNDAPALAEASVGVTLGSAGTDVALETADVALLGDDLEALAVALRIAQRTQTIVRQNLVLSAIVISALVVGALFGGLTLPLAVLGHEISEWVVIGNGLRMTRG